MATCEQTVSSEAEYDYNCTPCTQRERVTEAKKFCVECGDYFCSTCLSCHEHFGATKGHTLIACHEVSTGRVVLGLTNCKIHENKEEDMVCGEHNVVCCRVCIAVNHRGCKDIDYLPHAVQRFKEGQGEERSELENEVKCKIEQLQIACKEHKTRAVQLKIRKGTILKRLNLFKVSVAELIKSLVIEAETDIEDSYEPEIRRTQKHIQNTDKQLSQLNALSPDLKNKNDPNTLYKTVLECKRILNEMQMVQRTPDQKKLAKNDKYLARIMETVRNSLNVDRIFCTIKFAEPNMCMLSDGSFCLAHYQECKIIHIDKDLKEIDTFDSEGRVWGICVINQSKIAFTMPSLKKIQFLDYGSNPALKSSFFTNIHCRGIAYCNDTLYVTGGGQQMEEPGQINILDLKGNLLRKFEQYSQGKYFSTPRSLIANSECIFVTDYPNGVICLDLSGDRKWVHRNPKCKFPWGICFTPNGNLLISGRASSNIVAVGKDGEFLGELLTQNDDGLSEPESLIIDTPNNRLLVSASKSSVLKMFYFEDFEM